MSITITKDHADSIINALEDPSESLRLDYSGRHMYGGTCIGFVGDGLDLVRFVSHLTRQACNGDRHAAELIEDLEDRGFHEDSMGLDSIYYFPNWVADGDLIFDLAREGWGFGR